MKQPASQVALILCISVATPVVAQSAKCTIRDLPKGIAEIIISKYPGWIPEQISDLGPDDQALWTKAHGNLCPGIASGHFDNANRVDYAVLIAKRGSQKGGYKLLMFDQDSSGAWNPTIVVHSEGLLSSGPVISCVPSGEYSDPETGTTVKTKLDSVLLEWIEAAAQLYYWSGSKYHKVQVQD